MKTRNPWTIFIPLWIAGITVAMGCYKTAATLTLVTEDLGLSLTASGAVGSALSLTCMVCCFIGGMLTLKFSKKTLCIIGLLFGFVGGLIGAWAPSFAVMIAGRIVEGVSFGLMTVAGPALIGEVFLEEKRGLPSALWSLWVPIATTILFKIAAVMLDGFGWRGMWVFCAFLCLVAAVLFFFLVPKPSEKTQEVATGALGAQFVETLKSGPVLCLALVFGVFGIGMVSFTNLAGSFLCDTFGFDQGVANGYTTFLTYGMIMGGIFGGLVINRIKRREIFLIVASVLTGIFFVLEYNITDLGLVIPFMLVLGIVLQLVPAITFTLAPVAAPKPHLAGVAIGLITGIDQIGCFISAILVAGVVEANGGVWAYATIPMAVTAVLSVVGGVGYVYFMKKRATLAGEES